MTIKDSKTGGKKSKKAELDDLKKEIEFVSRCFERLVFLSQYHVGFLSCFEQTGPYSDQLHMQVELTCTFRPRVLPVPYGF